MKRIAYLFLIFIAVSCNKDKNTVIKGSIDNCSQKYIYLGELLVDGYKTLDSVELSSNGEFKFKTSISEPTFYHLLLKPTVFITLLVNPNEEVEIISDQNVFASKYSVSGSEGSFQVKVLNDRMLSTKSKIDSVLTVYKSKQNIAKNDTEYNSLNAKYLKIIKDQHTYSIDFILNHLNTLSSIVALYQQIDDNNYVLNERKDLQFIKLVSDTLQKYYPNSPYVKSLTADKERVLNELNREKIKSLSPKALSYPEISLPNAKGDTINLTSTKNKMVLLTFWSPQNASSYTALGNLAALYEQWKPKGLEFYNVALDENVAIWEKFIAAYKIQGINVLDRNAGNSYFARIYNVSQLPSNFLIDKKGNIVARDIWGVDLNEKLTQIAQ